MFSRTCSARSTVQAIWSISQSRMLASGRILTVDDIKQDTKNGVFYIPIETHKAELFYRQEKSIIHLDHTEVPEELNGRGVGKVLAQGAFKYVAEKNLKMKVHCDFLQHYLEKYGSEYKKYVA
ncbi:protein NATD1 [Phlebotomus argentipes]|uniref:protein NATD1 n=1 Tax=Phlebotomus argentipes TaxID=94469 RepID=UPI00289379D9|nr:protein NATD1 [Phlebotomus argentipes]